MNRLRGDDGGWGIAALPVGPASCRSSRVVVMGNNGGYQHDNVDKE